MPSRAWSSTSPHLHQPDHAPAHRSETPERENPRPDLTPSGVLTALPRCPFSQRPADTPAPAPADRHHQSRQHHGDRWHDPDHLYTFLVVCMTHDSYLTGFGCGQSVSATLLRQRMKQTGCQPRNVFILVKNQWVDDCLPRMDWSRTAGVCHRWHWTVLTGRSALPCGGAFQG